MSLKDLEEHGVLLPEEEWGTHDLSTTVPEGPLLAAFAAAVACLVVVYVGGGRLWTWLGLVGFVVVLGFLTVLCDRAIAAQRTRMEGERRAPGEEPEPTT